MNRLRVVVALVALALAWPALEDGAAQPRGGTSLTGRLLVAAETLRDPRFARSVIYLIRHDANGAFGVVINRPVGEVSYESALRPFKLGVPPGSGDVPVHYGGPVEPGHGAVLHTTDWSGEGTAVVDSRFAFTTNPKVLQEMAQGRGPRRAMFLLGYAGWAPGQLEAELRRGSWEVAVPDEALVFDQDPERKWRDATARRLMTL
jgi:putative transcriptional regulator